MAPRKLSPSVLAALGLSACVDGCEPADLPVVGRLFDDGGDDVAPCLKVAPIPVPPEDVGPCLEAPMADTAQRPSDREVHACLKVVMPTTPITKPAPVGPCLRMAPPRVGPCLRVRPPSYPPPTPSPPNVPVDDGAGALEDDCPEPIDVLAALVDEGVLAPDVLDRLTREDA
jgi:hypothetical protein